MAKKYKQKPQSVEIKIDLPAGQYIISEETTDTGVITVTCVPTDEQKKEFESALSSIVSQLANIDDQLVYLNALQDDLKAQKKDIEKIIDTL